jgi:hypothetical protein
MLAMLVVSATIAMATATPTPPPSPIVSGSTVLDLGEVAKGTVFRVCALVKNLSERPVIPFETPRGNVPQWPDGLDGWRRELQPQEEILLPLTTLHTSSFSGPILKAVTLFGKPNTSLELTMLLCPDEPPPTPAR